MKLPPRVASINSKGRKQLIITYDKHNKEFIAGYGKYPPSFSFPKNKRSRCTGQTPEEAVEKLNDFLAQNWESLNINFHKEYEL